jgi:acetolactate decarboxylase
MKKSHEEKKKGFTRRDFLRASAGTAGMVALGSLPRSARASVETESNNTVLQISTVSALEHGVFYPVTTVGELKKHGNHGVGAFEHMDGELILLDGKAYNGMYSGKVVLMDDNAPITYGAISSFKPNTTVSLQNIPSYAGLQQSIDKLLPNINNFYAIKAAATFSYLKYRSTAKQEKPYPPLSYVVAHQSIFEPTNIKGTVVGVRLPNFINGVYAPGYHLHFISDDLVKGGHILELRLADASVQIQYLSHMLIKMPESDGARRVDLAVPYKQ